MRGVRIDNHKRNLTSYGESYKFIQKIILNNKTLIKTLKGSSLNKSALLRVSAVKLVNRCSLTGRQAGAGAYFRISRLMFLKLARTGTLFGLEKYVR